MLKDDRFYANYTLLGPEAEAAGGAVKNEVDDKDKEQKKEGCLKSFTCHRTQAVLRLLALPHRRYAAFVSGSDDGSGEQVMVDAYLANLLKKYERQIMDKLEEVEALQVENQEPTRNRKENSGKKEKSSSGKGEVVLAEQKDVLKRRWLQVRGLVNGAVRGLGG
jgi:hypothetical protein